MIKAEMEKRGATSTTAETLTSRRMKRSRVLESVFAKGPSMLRKSFTKRAVIRPVGVVSSQREVEPLGERRQNGRG